MLSAGKCYLTSSMLKVALRMEALIEREKFCFQPNTPLHCPGINENEVALTNAQTCFCLLSGHGQVATAKPGLGHGALYISINSVLGIVGRPPSLPFLFHTYVHTRSLHFWKGEEIRDGSS